MQWKLIAYTHTHTRIRNIPLVCPVALRLAVIRKVTECSGDWMSWVSAAGPAGPEALAAHHHAPADNLQVSTSPRRTTLRRDQVRRTGQERLQHRMDEYQRPCATRWEHTLTSAAENNLRNLTTSRNLMAVKLLWKNEVTPSTLERFSHLNPSSVWTALQLCGRLQMTI